MQESFSIMLPLTHRDMVNACKEKVADAIEWQMMLCSASQLNVERRRCLVALVTDFQHQTIPSRILSLLLVPAGHVRPQYSP